MTATAFMANLCAFACVGAVTAFAHLKLLAWNVGAVLDRPRGLPAACMASCRVALTVVAFLFAILYGAPALIALFAGFLAGRSLVLRYPELFVP